MRQERTKDASLFRTKICGVKSAAAIHACAGANVDAIGLNFFPQSKRYIRPDAAADLVPLLPDKMTRVGLFVNAPLETVVTTASQLTLDLIQLHGNEDAEYVARLYAVNQLGGEPDAPRYIRAFRFGVSGLEPVVAFLEATSRIGHPPLSVLIDADVPGEYGGTGVVADWARLAQEKEAIGKTKLILAGGLTPTNVCDAIESVCPDGVDTASGVENSAGEKRGDLCKQFVDRANEAFSR